jgi:hypothetical protein
MRTSYNAHKKKPSINAELFIKKKPRRGLLIYFSYICDDLLQLQGHIPHPGQHIKPLINIAKLIIPEIPTIHTAGTTKPGIVFIIQAKKS